jgi:hypothetical protein
MKRRKFGGMQPKMRKRAVKRPSRLDPAMPADPRMTALSELRAVAKPPSRNSLVLCEPARRPNTATIRHGRAPSPGSRPGLSFAIL